MKRRVSKRLSFGEQKPGQIKGISDESGDKGRETRTADNPTQTRQGRCHQTRCARRSLSRPSLHEGNYLPLMEGSKLQPAGGGGQEEEEREEGRDAIPGVRGGGGVGRFGGQRKNKGERLKDVE